MRRAKTLKIKTAVDKKYLSSFASSFDLQGSYTGICSDDKFEIPIQDADDL